MTNWDSLIKISEDRMIYSTGIWVFITPALVKAYNLNTDTNMLIAESVTDSSAILLYFAALCFFISGLICKIFCPQIITSTSSYADFESKQMSHINMQDFINNSTDISKQKIAEEINRSISKPEPKDIDENSTFFIEVHSNACFNIKKPDTSLTYWTIRKIHNTQHMFMIFICIAFYSLGTFLLAALLFNNAKLVTKFAFSL